MVKGVSDFADDNKSTTDKWRAFASTMAASVVVNMLSDPGVFDNWPHHEVSIDLSAHRIDKGMVGNTELNSRQFVDVTLCSQSGED